jgi:hypothetical protein
MVQVPGADVAWAVQEVKALAHEPWGAARFCTYVIVSGLLTASPISGRLWRRSGMAGFRMAIPWTIGSVLEEQALRKPMYDDATTFL